MLLIDVFVETGVFTWSYVQAVTGHYSLVLGDHLMLLYFFSLYADFFSMFPFSECSLTWTQFLLARRTHQTCKTRFLTNLNDSMFETQVFLQKHVEQGSRHNVGKKWHPPWYCLAYIRLHKIHFTCFFQNVLACYSFSKKIRL